MENQGTGWKHWLILGLSFLLMALLSLISIHIPFARDQGVAAYVAQLMLSGHAVYRDVYHFNFPGIFFAYVTAFKLFGQTVEAVNFFDLIVRLGVMLSVYLTARISISPRHGLWSAAAYGIFSTVLYNNYWDNAQKETFASLPLALSLLAAVWARQGRRGKWLSLVLTGVFSAGTCYFKPTLGLVLPAIIAFVIWPLRNEIKKAGPAVSVITVGFVLAWIPLLAYLVLNHALSAMIDGVFVFGRFYGGQRYTSVADVLGLMLIKSAGWLLDWRFLCALAVAGCIQALAAGSGEQKFMVLAAGVILLNVLLQMKFFTYHWIPLLVPVSILASVGYYELTGLARESGRVLLRRGLALLLFALLIGNLSEPLQRYNRELLYDLGWIGRDDFLRAYGKWGFGDLCAQASHEVAKYLNEHTHEQDPILVFSIEPGIYFEAKRYPRTRFAYDQPLTADPRGNEKFIEYREKIRREFLGDIHREPPEYIVVAEKDTSIIEPHDSFSQLQEFKDFQDIVNKYYYLQTKIEHYFLYQLKPGSQAQLQHGGA